MANSTDVTLGKEVDEVKRQLSSLSAGTRTPGQDEVFDRISEQLRQLETKLGRRPVSWGVRGSFFGQVRTARADVGLPSSPMRMGRGAPIAHRSAAASKAARCVGSLGRQTYHMKHPRCV